MFDTAISIFEKVTSVYEEFDKNKTLKDAVREQIVAELRFNSEVLDEIGKSYSSKVVSKRQHIAALTGILETSAFDGLQQSCIPIRLLFTDERKKTPEAEKFWNDAKGIEGSKSFYSWSEMLLTHTELVSRIYHRIKITRALYGVEISKNVLSIRYLQWLIAYHTHYLKQAKN